MSEVMTGRVLSRRRFLGGLGASAVGLGLAGCGIDGDDPPDIVVLVLDSLRARSLPMYGHSRNTAPFLAGLATRSTLFERCYAAATWTRPSVISILSGLPPQVHRGGPFEIPYPADHPSFARRLGETGYDTGFFTANTAIGESFGVESQFDHVDYGAAKDYHWGSRLTEDCAAWLGTLGEDATTFVYIHFHPPHGPYHPPEEFVKRARSEPASDLGHLPHHQRGGAKISLAANVLGKIPWYQAKRTLSDDLIDYQQRYEANIAYADSLAAGFFAVWEQIRGHRRTVFFVTGDHGEGLGEHGLLCDHGKLLIDEILHVPLLVHDTARPVAATVGRPVSHLDLSVTILELGGVPRRIGMMNESLLDDDSSERVIVSHQEDWLGGEGGLALTSERWRLVYNPGARYGGGHIMEVKSGNPDSSTLTGVPLPLPSIALRRPVEIADGTTLESFAFHSHVLTGEADLRFSGTFRTTGDAVRLAIRVRAPGSPPVLLGPFAAGDFEGEIQNVGEEHAERLIVEAAPWTGAGPTRPEPEWRHLLTVPVFKSRRLNKALEIRGSVTEPAAACPGESVHISLHWRAHRNAGKDIGVVVELVGPDGEVTIRETRRFFKHYPSPNAKPRPLLDNNKVEQSTFSQASLDFEDAFWWTLPASLRPGSYRVAVGLLDYRELFSEELVVNLADPVPVGTLEISESRSEHLRIHLRRELGIESLRFPPGWLPGPAEVPMIQVQAHRFPDEGHLDFLLARRALGDAEKRDRLRACLEKTPYHRRALAELALADDEGSKRVLDRLTPSKRCVVRFGGVIQLAGFDLCRGDDCVYLTLFWEAEAVSSLLFAARISFSGSPAAEESSETTFSWFIGGEQRPTHRWMLGETVVETIRLSIEPATTELSITLRLVEWWRNAYSGKRGLFFVTSGNGVKTEPVTADLGSFRVNELPQCDADFLARKRGDPTQCILIDLLGDPGQTRDLRLENPEVFSKLHRQLGAVLTLGDFPAREDDGKEVELSEETKEQLRALGYLD